MYFLFNIGATNTRAAFSQDGETIETIVLFPTPQNFDEAVRLLAKAAKDGSQGEHIMLGVGGVAGAFDKEKSALLGAPNLPQWVGKPLRDKLAKAIGARFYLENDAALEGLGEAVKGAGKGKDITAYLTIGTGVGGVRIVDGKIDANSMGFEPGHQIISPMGRACACGGFGHLEAYISGTAIEKKFHKKPEEIDDERMWNEIAEHFARGINNTLVFWSPDMVVLGGSLMKKISITNIESHLKNMIKIFPSLPPVKNALLGEKAGLEGALVYINQIV